MQTILAYFFPAKADNTIRSSRLPFYLLLFIATIGTARSLIHIFAPDGGAGSIAGMDLTIPGANGIIFAFALWGSAQLIYALLQWLVIFRYRSLVPSCGLCNCLRPSFVCWLAVSSQSPLPTLHQAQLETMCTL
jgi:hypothetical protein